MFWSACVLSVALNAALPTNENPDTAATTASVREWFGGKPWWEWERAFGDLGGLRPKLADYGVTIEAEFTADVTKVESGGLDRSTKTRALLSIGAGVDLEAAIGLSGGHVYAEFQSQSGSDGSRQMGDLQVYDNISSRNYQQLMALWYRQGFGEHVWIKAGKIDANADFAYVESAGDFMHSSKGFVPTIFVLPTFPDPATGVEAFVEAGPVSLGFGLFDGALQEGVPTGNRGPRTFFGEPSDLFLIGEAQIRWEVEKRSCRAAVGAWYHTGDFTKFTGGEDSGTGGVFATLEQDLYASEGRKITVNAQFGSADESVAEIERFLGFGVVANGWVPGRPNDSFGFGGNQADLTDRTGPGFTKNHETAYELYYRAVLTPWWTVQLDGQWIDNPGGAGAPDATVGIVRTVITF